MAHFHPSLQPIIRLLRLHQFPALLLVRLGKLLTLLLGIIPLNRNRGKLPLQPVNLRIRLLDDLVQPHAQRRVLVRQRLVEVLLVANLLRRLVRPEAERAARALHDCAGAQPAQDTRLVGFCRAEVRDGCVFGRGQLGAARGAVGSVVGVAL